MEESQAITHQFEQQEREQEISALNSPSPELTGTQTSFEQEPLAADQSDGQFSDPSWEILQGMQDLYAEMESLRRDFDTKVKYDASKEHTIDSLHRELQLHREGLHFRILRPVFIDLIQLYDDMAKVLENTTSSAAVNTDQEAQLVQHIRVFQEVVVEMLRRNGAEPFTVEGELFAPNRQRSVKIIPTAEPALDKSIARRVRQGFTYEDKLLRHEIVEVYKYVPVSE